MSNQALPSMTLTEEQNKLVLEFREKTQESFTKLLQNLYASKLENPSLLILEEMASLVVSYCSACLPILDTPDACDVLGHP